MKKVICAILLICILLMLVACSTTTDKQDDKQTAETARFIVVHHELITDTNDIMRIKILVDTETRVMYMYTTGAQESRLTVLVDKEGNPMLWEEAIDE